MCRSEHSFLQEPLRRPQWVAASAGLVTAIPLLLFAASARRIPFAHLGNLQFMSPPLQLLLGL
jgi:chloramphenicol-sensitive protein RarD